MAGEKEVALLGFFGYDVMDPEGKKFGADFTSLLTCDQPVKSMKKRKHEGIKDLNDAHKHKKNKAMYANNFRPIK
ncbi:hypothetical protein QJS10_CPB11g01799 [Acorus calamus]|uniref:Uncharacterized protein n=1 Tax=Acorus calamus TaxID=4465 RepID=A0AAV9DWR3_ACOCL|nr:hypothetical protein QJS10_CPB11g01799 [Acorus calamus]